MALATANQVLMFEHSIYAMLSPEGFASIMFKDAKRAPEAAELLGLTPQRTFGEKRLWNELSLKAMIATFL